MDEIVIRPPQTLAEIDQAETVQREAWGIGDLDVVPAHLLHALQHNGAALVGAFDGATMVGMSLAVLATVESLKDRVDPVAAARLKMHSAVTGVLPAYQNSDIGYRLKMAQREFALRIGVRLITWTYDPLLSVNARFNIGKLGAVCRTYLPNFYGELEGINAGLPSDRFEVEWWVTSKRAQSRAGSKWRPIRLDALLAGGAVLVNETSFDAAGRPVPPAGMARRPGTLQLVEIPYDFAALKMADSELAQQWREHSRAVFTALFHDGYLVTDFAVYEDEQGRDRSFYLLTHQDS